jgi:hypothetical protein
MIAIGIRWALRIVAPQDSSSLLLPDTTIEQTSWIEHMIALTIQAFHEDISLTWIIDFDEQLHPLLHAELSLQVYIVPKLHQIIFNTIDLATKTSTLWVNQHGCIIGINPYKEPSKTMPLRDDLIVWSKQKRLLVLQSYAQKRMYSIMHKGTVRDNLSSHHAYHMIKHILTPQHNTHAQELP